MAWQAAAAGQSLQGLQEKSLGLVKRQVLIWWSSTYLYRLYRHSSLLCWARATVALISLSPGPVTPYSWRASGLIAPLCGWTCCNMTHWHYWCISCMLNMHGWRTLSTQGW